MIRFQVTLEAVEAKGLAKLAERELRDPREHIRFLIRQELNRNGLLEPEKKTDCNEVEGVSK